MVSTHYERLMKEKQFKNPPLLENRLIKMFPFSERDIGETYLGWLNDPVVTRFSNQRFFRHTSDSCIEYLRGFNKTENLFLLIRRQSDDSRIGTMTAYINKYHSTADIGLMIGDRSCWGMGFGQSAWNCLGEFLLYGLNIRKLTGGTLRGNLAMVSIMQKFGMTLEGVRREQEVVEGSLQDLVYYAKFSRSGV